MEERYIRRNGAVHRYFGLTYANWLILPRTVMQDMPTVWQDKFVELLEEMDDTTNWRDFLWQEQIDLIVVAKKGKKFCKLPEELYEYRHPIKKWVKE